MLIQAQSFTLNHIPYTPNTFNITKLLTFSPHLTSPKSLKNQIFKLSAKTPTSFHVVKCSAAAVAVDELTQTDFLLKPSPAEICRTIVELSSSGTLSTVTQEGWPLGTGVNFAVDHQGTPILCINASNKQFLSENKSSLHVKLEQRGSRTTQCMLQGGLTKPEDKTALQKLCVTWNKRFEGEVNEDDLYVLSVERVLQIEDLNGDGVWVTSSEYKSAIPDPLRDSAEILVEDINTNHMEDFERICNIYLNIGFQVAEANLIWVDRLGFDVHVKSPQNETFEARIPFPREVADEKGVKSSFNCMAQHAWEVDRTYTEPDFEKSNVLKQVR
ncbi:hypothetical protein ACHQM5_030263 [Ranunculus cassubicifolius]